MTLNKINTFTIIVIAQNPNTASIFNMEFLFFKLWYPSSPIYFNMEHPHELNTSYTFQVSRTLDSVTTLTMIRSFISCYFNYCPLVWIFCGNEYSRALERIQFRTLKFVYNGLKSSNTELLEVSGMSSLYQQRIRLLATEMYKP